MRPIGPTAVALLSLAAFWIAACQDQGVGPLDTGSITLQVVLDSADAHGVAPAPGANDSLQPQFEVLNHLTSAEVRVDGPTTKTQALTASGANFTGTVTGLDPGTYTVSVAGLVGSDVDYFGTTSGVAVTAGKNANAGITFSNFRPGIVATSTFTPTQTFNVAWRRVSNATGYTVQWSSSASFASANSKTATDTATSITVGGNGTWYVRVRASNALITGGRFSDSIVVSVNPVWFAGSVSTTSGGFGDTVRIRRPASVTWDGDEFVTLGRKTPAWLLRRTADSLYVLVPNRPVASNDTLWVRNQGAAQMVSAVPFEITSSFAVNIDTGNLSVITSLPFSQFISLSDSTPDHLMRIRSNLPRGLTAVLFWQDTLDLTVGDSVDLDLQWANGAFTQWRGNWDAAGLNFGEVSTVDMPPNDEWIIWIQKFSVNDGAEVMARVFVKDTAVYHDVGSGYLHTCGLKTGGQASCWGWNGVGQLGKGDTIRTKQPQPVNGSLQFRQVVTSEWGSVSCGIAADSTGYCWGANAYGQVGNASAPNPTTTPMLVSGGLKFAMMSAGVRHACGLTVAGVVYCWGDNTYGQLGDAGLSGTGSATPVQVASGLTFRWIDAGGYHTCAVATTMDAYCWGYDDYGRLGDGSVAPAPQIGPTLVAGSHAFRTVSAGAYHSCGVTTTDALYCWGYNGDGQLGTGASDANVHSTPVLITSMPVVDLVSAGGYHTCGMAYDPTENYLTDRAEYCWGYNSSGQLGVGDSTDNPVPALVAGMYQAPRAGGYHSCSVDLSARLSCWGLNTYGEVGNGDTTNVYAPLEVLGQAPPAPKSSGRSGAKRHAFPNASPLVTSRPSQRATPRRGFTFGFPLGVGGTSDLNAAPIATFTSAEPGPRSKRAPRN